MHHGSTSKTPFHPEKPLKAHKTPCNPHKALASELPLDVRVGISYGEILVDPRGGRHGTAINKAFRLEALSAESFTKVEGEEGPKKIADRNRIFLDEEAVRELNSSAVPLRSVGFCALKGFSGLHRVFEVLPLCIDF